MHAMHANENKPNVPVSWQSNTGAKFKNILTLTFIHSGGIQHHHISLIRITNLTGDGHVYNFSLHLRVSLIVTEN